MLPSPPLTSSNSSSANPSPTIPHHHQHQLTKSKSGLRLPELGLSAQAGFTHAHSRKGVLPTPPSESGGWFAKSRREDGTYDDIWEWEMERWDALITAVDAWDAPVRGGEAVRVCQYNTGRTAHDRLSKPVLAAMRRKYFVANGTDPFVHLTHHLPLSHLMEFSKALTSPPTGHRTNSTRTLGGVGAAENEVDGYFSTERIFPCFATNPSVNALVVQPDSIHIGMSFEPAQFAPKPRPGQSPFAAYEGAGVRRGANGYAVITQTHEFLKWRMQELMHGGVFIYVFPTTRGKVGEDWLPDWFKPLDETLAPALRGLISQGVIPTPLAAQLAQSPPQPAEFDRLVDNLKLRLEGTAEILQAYTVQTAHPATTMFEHSEITKEEYSRRITSWWRREEEDRMRGVAAEWFKENAAEHGGYSMQSGLRVSAEEVVRRVWDDVEGRGIEGMVRGDVGVLVIKKM
ncbi:hypothetical protein SAICODRAFT_17777 [Saitoella complicata NRRL Y-17804]|uniref:uncharacterized protein n=1 Tax=Saitoella complicata (strain BCRC 22490 / CBS 7301 / JCM 7358 / NBRC 10748 / NRRL Y-17804) TaxID=698492 RepID=UPI000867E761|nr:uncharacterized protein SAICODRAFT_17777 [Saitoella complicata NRRL Y-17804]ODQ54788.1 hypothetical protein SAICODRAFT_17777 [Saitoella complicata NRRL Y-17804]